MIDVATTGPCHSRIAGIAKPVVLPVCVGPIDDHRLARLGRYEVAVDAAEREASGLRRADTKRSEVPRLCPARTGSA